MDLRFTYRGLKARYRDQRAELGALARALKPGDIAVDVGANKGSYVWTLARAVGPRGRVVAFEPQPSLVAYLSHACRDRPNVTVEAAGVSARSGALTLIIPGEGSSSPDASFEDHAAGDGARRIEVSTFALDDYFAGETARIGAIKIDVEGHEAAVVEGAVGLIARDRPALVIECEQRHLSGGATVEALIGRVLGAGYDGFFVRRGALTPVAQFDRATHQVMGESRFWDSPDYCNNFVFLART